MTNSDHARRLEPSTSLQLMPEVNDTRTVSFVTNDHELRLPYNPKPWAIGRTVSPSPEV